MRKIFLLLILFSSFIWANPKTVLFLNSYSREFKWTERQLKGIENVQDKENYKSYYEYLNINEVNGKAYLEEYKKLLKIKYADIQIDLVVTTDDFAYKFLTENKDIFKKIPYVIASGVVEYGYEKNTSYILKEFDIDRNLDLIKKQFTKDKTVKNIYFVIDDTEESKVLKERIKNYLSFNKDFNFIWLSSDYNILKKELKEIRGNSAIIHLSYFKDNNQLSLDYKKILKDLYEGIEVPIYSVFDFYLLPDTNIMGGYVVDAEKFGEKIGEAIKNYFQGNSVNNSINIANYSDYKFSLDEIEEFDVKYIPIKSEIYSKQMGYLKSRKYEILSIIIILIISGINIYHNRRNYKAQKKINEQNKKIWELDRDLYKTQKEVIAALGQIIENRSKETANHTTRVAQISRYIGELMGFDEEEAASIEIASPLHDVGKIGIPDNVLEKAGKLTNEEYDIIKTHSAIGYSILKESKIPILTIAANIAHEHHERWDGKGYPKGISGEKISIYARITAVADIFDALLSKRVYKEPWPMDKVLDFYRDEKGKIFDPKIVDVFLENIDKVIEIRERLRD